MPAKTAAPEGAMLEVPQSYKVQSIHCWRVFFSQFRNRCQTLRFGCPIASLPIKAQAMLRTGNISTRRWRPLLLGWRPSDGVNGESLPGPHKMFTSSASQHVVIGFPMWSSISPHCHLLHSVIIFHNIDISSTTLLSSQCWGGECVQGSPQRKESVMHIETV